MKKWLHSSLVVSVAMLTACTATSSPNNNLPVRKARAPAKIVRIAPEYRQDAPERYVVRRGDTLWGIASRFLKSPARWREIWHANPQIKNPNLIYPGDIISYVTVGGKRKLQVAGSNNPIRSRYTGRKTADGRPIYRVKPGVQTEYVDEPIPTIPKEAVYPFMSKNKVLEPGISSEYPYVVGQQDGSYISLSGRKEIYAKTDDGAFNHEEYDVFRETKPLNDPVTGESLGVEAVYVGHLRLVKNTNEDGVGTFVQTDSVNPLYPKDILIPHEEMVYGGDLNFLPKLAQLNEQAVVVRPIGASGYQNVSSQFGTILINVGSGGVEPGDVFKVVRAGDRRSTGRDGESFRLPDYEVGVGMVYRTFENSSYALILNAYDTIYPGDRLVTP
ncbi:MAG: hypothetical protein CR975_02885 [Gammaproteobacteria bacterium]|nr:MAG: hypothetical protein CR975_02885 [Gammaproteobacteria bacterium]